MEITFAIITIAALTMCGILANSLRHRSNLLSKLREDYHELSLTMEEEANDLASKLAESQAKLKNSHQRIGKKMLPLGTNPDGSKV